MTTITIKSELTTTITVEGGPDQALRRKLEERGLEVPFSLSPLPTTFQDERELAAWLNAHPSLWGAGFMEWVSQPWKTIQDVDDPSDIILCTERPHSREHIHELATYFFEGEFAGEYYTTDELFGYRANALEGRLFRLGTDFTKSRRDDWGMVIDGLWTILREGSPVRKTNMAGPGTKGTRKVEGIDGRFWLCFR